LAKGRFNMGFREVMGRHRHISTALAILLICCGVAATIVQIRPPTVPPRSNQFYFIDEDRADVRDLFTDDKELIPPFDHGGKQAVRAHVYVVNGKRTIGYLEKAADEFKKALEQQKLKQTGAAKGAAPAVPVSVRMKMNPFGTLVKRPGEREWIGVRSGPKYAQTVAISNASENQEVFPEP
jgi:hypothetical protein